MELLVIFIDYQIYRKRYSGTNGVITNPCSSTAELPTFPIVAKFNTQPLFPYETYLWG